jgi:DNA (cytosine-5)-methyltransferase 1
MKLGSLFDGIGGFPLVASRHGIEPVWASEIEPFPVKVTQKHFPSMKHLGDITKISGAEIEPVDIITFGSPCQDLSVAGKREGLQGERSNLFYEAVRIIEEMLRATSGLYPTFAIWENVPGALSSNGGQDFRAVLRSLAEIGAVDIAWRVLDAQYFGVPQRRRRIFLVADFRGERAGEILFESEGVSGDTSQGRKSREEVAGSVGDCVAEASQPITISAKQQSLNVNCDLANTLGANDFKEPQVVAKCVTTGTGRRYDPETETLIPVLADQGGSVMSVSYGITPTLRAQEHGHQPLVPHAVDCRNLYETQELSGTLQSKQTGGYSLNYQNPVRVGCAVRRLTPTECLRLQGFPDWWLDGIDGYSDTKAYKAIGNSLAVPVVEWIFSRLVEVNQ